jgi:glycosyltransferase involved in cell wall biosynthesis
MTRAVATILIPAYNEETEIYRSLAPLALAPNEGRFQVIVIANGCTDDTAGAARRICPDAEIIELREGSKVGALNVGAARRRGWVTVCLDADVEITEASVSKLIEPLLEAKADFACGRMIADLSGASALVKSFYRGWMLNPYFDGGKAGGVYAMADWLVRELFPLPRVIADDEYVARRTERYRKTFVPRATFRVHTPKRLHALMQIRRRSRRGTAALEQSGLIAKRPTNGSGAKSALRRALHTPKRLPDVLIYLAAMVWIRASLALSSKDTPETWERDNTSRNASQCARATDRVAS